MIEQLDGAQSTRYSIVRQHMRDEGLMAMGDYGVPGTPVTCRICQVCSPFETLTIYWLAEKQGMAPVIPRPELFDTNNVFLFGGRSVEAPKLLPSIGGHTFALWGEYHYAVITPIGLNANFNSGLPAPDTITDIKDTTIPSNYFQRGILDNDVTAGYAAPGAQSADEGLLTEMGGLHDQTTGEGNDPNFGFPIAD